MGKSSSPPPPPPTIAQPNSASLDSILGPIMSMASQMAMIAARPPELPPMPEIESAPNINWASKYEELAKKVRADYDAAQETKKTRESTVHASDIYKSPLLTNAEDEISRRD